MNITFNGEITASNTESRVIEGRIVTYGERGNTSAGATVFAKGSIRVIDASKVKLVSEHSRGKPIGRVISLNQTEEGITASFKISRSTQGDDALILASEGLITGLSVGVDNVVATQGKDFLTITDCTLDHVGHVAEPAIESAQISRVAASASDTATPPTPAKESEAIVSTQEVAPSAPAETTPAATPEVTPPAVDASRPATPYIQTSLRSPIITAADYAKHQVHAALGNDDSKRYVLDADAKFGSVLTAANDSFTTNPAFTPIQYMNEFITNTRNFGRPAIEACGGTKPLPSQGMTFNIPKLTTAPAVASAAEAASVTNTGMVTAYITGTKVKYAGTNIISREIIDNGSDSPLFYSELMAEMNAAYNDATDAAVIASLTANGQQAAITAGTIAGMESFIGTEAVAAYTGTGYFAKNLLAGTSWWTSFIGAVDTTGRPLFNATQPMNPLGESSATARRGSILDLDLYVDRKAVATSVNESAFIIAPDSVGVYESPRTFLQIQVLPTLEVQVALYGYMAVVVKLAAGVRRYRTV